MKRKIFSVAVLLCLLFSTSFLLFGCGDGTGCGDGKQITMVQVRDAVTEHCSEKGISCFSNYYSAEGLLNWQRRFEMNNISTEHFTTYSRLYIDDVANIYVFKFTYNDDANNCAQKFNNIAGYDTYEVKQYGNLVVVASNGYGNEIFGVIDRI